MEEDGKIVEVCEEGAHCGRPQCTVPQCVACLDDLARTASEMAAGHDPTVRATAEEKATTILETGKELDTIAPLLANQMLRTIRHVTGVADPFAQYKVEEMEQSRKAFERIRDRVSGDLRSAVRLAGIGNSLDFYRSPSEAFAELSALLDDDGLFFHDDTSRLEAMLEARPKLVLYLTDNAGEIFFDLPLYTYLEGKADRVILVVKKEPPAINDLTRADLERAGLLDRFSEVSDTGTDGIGVEWERVSTGFMELLDQAGLVICKGGANFETVYPRAFTAPAFFIFRAKCRPNVEHIDSPPNAFWALWRDGKYRQ